jgi:hypothetical protein
MSNRFEVSQSRRGMLPGLQPLLDRALGIAGGGQVMGEQFGLALDEIGEVLLERRRDARVQFLPSAAEQGRLGGVLHQRVLNKYEECGGVPRQNSSPASPSWSKAACNSAADRGATGSISS